MSLNRQQGLELIQEQVETGAETLQAKLSLTLTGLREEAVVHSNIHADQEMIASVDFLEEHLIAGDDLSFEERIELRNRFDAIRLTLQLAMQAEEWGKEPADDFEDDERQTEIALPVLTDDSFYEPIFDALASFLEASPAPIFISKPA